MMNAPSRSSADGSLKGQQREAGFLFNNGMTPFKGWSPYLVRSIHDAYPELEDVFYAELGNSFMNKEGNICMAIAEWAVREQVPVLTLQTALFVLHQTHMNRNKSLLYTATK